MENTLSKTVADINQIRNTIPHRYPFLLVDRVNEMVEGVSATGYKNMTSNEPFFQGHFPGNPIMPGVLMIEALAQLGCFAMLSKPDYKNKLGLFAGIDNVRFKRPVIPGDKLDLHVELIKLKGPIGKFKGLASVNGETACEAELMFAIVDKPADRSI